MKFNTKEVQISKTKDGVKVTYEVDGKEEPNPLYVQHAEKLEYIQELYIQKNRAYGNSFDLTLDDVGIIGAYIRMSDKWNRFRELSKDPGLDYGDESLEDTLIDLANYAIMTVMWLERQEENK